jgi:hypothetical protein
VGTSSADPGWADIAPVAQKVCRERGSQTRAVREAGVIEGLREASLPSLVHLLVFNVS